MVAPNIAQDDRTTHVQGFYTLQNQEQGKEDTTETVSHENTTNTTLCMLYAKAVKRQDMNFHDYCTHIYNLNTEQCHIVMYNRAWCKSYINAVRHGGKKKGYRIFLSGPGIQVKVMLYISYKETCLTFSNTQLNLMMINLLS